MQKRIDTIMSVFTRIVNELDKRIGELNGAIVANDRLIEKATHENDQYLYKIDEYQALKDRVESIIK
jgi:hypothetical protein